MMPSDVDLSKWSGEGTFTQALIGHLKGIAGVHAIRVEDAPATRSEADYNFISNEVFVTFATVARAEAVRRFRFLPSRRRVAVKAMALKDLEALLTVLSDV